MGSFEGQRWRPYLDQETQKIRDEKLDHLQRNYDGPTDFVKQKLKEEEVLSVEEKIEKYRTEIQEKEESLEKLQQIKRERDQQDKLRDKKELLRKKQQELMEVKKIQNASRDEIRDQVKESILKHKPPRLSDEDYLEEKSSRIERLVDSKLECDEDIDELVEDVQRLQGQVEDLNGGCEDWFLDLDVEGSEVSV